MAVIGKIIAMTGVANIINEKGESRAVVPGEQLQTGDTLQTPPGVTVKVQLENGRVIDVAAGQMVSFTEELTNVIVPDETENAVDLATIDTVIDAIENGQDLDEVLEATAAGGAGGSEGGHSAVFLDRINLLLNPLALNAASDAANDISVNPTNGFLNPLLAEQFVATPAAVPDVTAPITVVSVTPGVEDPNNPGTTVGDQVIEGVETDPLLFEVGLSAVPAGGEEVILTFSDITAEFGVDTASTISIDFGDGNGFIEFPVVGNTVTVAVPAGAQNFVVSLATVDDTAVEGLEQLTLTASTTSNVGTLPSATGGIIDNDGIVFVQSVQAGTGTFNPTIPGGINGSIVVEGDVNDPLLFQVGLNAATPLSGAIVTLFFENSGDGIFGTDTTTNILIDIGDGNGFLPVRAQPQTGTGPNNEVETFYNVQLPANVQNFVVSVPTTDDSIIEAAERILFTASTVNNDSENPTPTQVTGTILDDDTPLRVDAVQAGTGDFNPTIPGGVVGSIVTEGDVEDPLLFEVELNRVAQDGDEVVTLSFTNAGADFGVDTTENILIDFGDGNGFVAVVATAQPGGAGETTYAISVPAGIQSFVVSVPTTDDEFEEPAENILFTAYTTNNDVTNPAPTQVTGTILDDDTPVYVETIQAGIEPVNQPGADLVGDEVDEGESLFFSVDLNTFAPVGGAFVSLTFIDNTAEFGVDTSSQIEVNFGDGNGFVPVTVSPTTDNDNNKVYNITVPEGIQSFEVKVPTVVDTDPEVSEALFFTATTTANETLPIPIEPVRGTIFDNDFELPAVSGLNGEYYGYNDNPRGDYTYIIDGSYRVHGDDETSGFVTVGNVDSVADIETIINGRNGSAVVGTADQAAEGVPDLRFYASTLRYGLTGTENLDRFVNVDNDLGNNVVQAAGETLSSESALATFLADDASSAVVEEGISKSNPASAADTAGTTSGIGRTSDSIIRITGSVFLERGNYDFRVFADDGFRMKLGGETVFEYDGNAYIDEYEFKNLSIDGEQAGLTPLELIYWEQGTFGVLHVEYKLSSEDEYRTFSVENLPMFPLEYPDLKLADNQTIVNTGTVDNPVWEIQTGLNISGVGTITGSERADILSGSDSDDTLEGLGGSDDLNGGAGNDILIGGAGNDRLDGGAGMDEMRGGVGDDYYVVDSAGDIFEEVLGEGTDTIELDASFNPGTFSINENFENLDAMGDQAISVTGNTSNNRIQTGAGDDTIDGGVGDDRISGGAGNDVLTGGDGKDVFEWNLSDEGVGAPAVDRITDFQYSGDSSDAIDLRDLLQDEVSSIRYGGNIGNLLDYIEINESAGTTTINISSSGNIDGGADQQIILENVNLFSDAGVGAGDQAALLHNLLNNGTLIVD